MSTVILLSSSPPPVFARSPTPADSSPLPSTATLVQSSSTGLKRFKTTKRQRDGFSSSFTTARHILADKCGAKNLTIQSPSRNRFKSSQEGEEVEENGRDISATYRQVPSAVKSDKAGCRDSQTNHIHESAQGDIQIASHPHGSERPMRGLDSPLFLERAVARKLDWTPPKENCRQDENKYSRACTTSFDKSVMEGFAYVDQSKSKTHSPVPEPINPAKRRRVESKAKADVMNAPSLPVLKPVKRSSGTAKPALKRNRSPAKKALTITGLATSHFTDHDNATESPMMQYLTSTQAQSNPDASDEALEAKVQQTKMAAKKLKDSKKNKSKSLLLSPESAMKSFDSQEAIFGSASQLAREDSPTFLRETIEAIKESESFMRSDPFSSPQRTQQASTTNTPKTGTVRYKRTRNLWAAAGRDEDNALLHVDTIDLTDTPAVRAAFAGKDVMVQPKIGRASSPFGLGKSLRGQNSPFGINEPIIDITDVETPCLVQKRRLSSTTKSANQETPSTLAHLEPDQTVLSKNMNLSEAKVVPPPKPNYAGFTTHDLQKQIKSFGFKALRKREKMIELLDRCWEDKYGPTEKVNMGPEAVPFGDFLSKVHDLSARPEPKVKKTRAKKKDESEKTLKEKPPKKPRQRKKKEVELGDEKDGSKEAKPKVTRKRKSKATVSKERSVLDIDDIEDTIPEEMRLLGAFEDWAKPDPKPKSKSKTTTVSKVQTQPSGPATTESNRPLTPPATLPLIAVLTSSPGFEDATSHVQAPAHANPTPSSTPPPLSTQITAAIMHQSQIPSQAGSLSKSTSPAKRNHISHPTWHEKILLYDPIVLEDVALWLNTEGLNAIGEDREVSALEVREWCETRGVCCLWKGGWRGNGNGNASK